MREDEQAQTWMPSALIHQLIVSPAVSSLLILTGKSASFGVFQRAEPPRKVAKTLVLQGALWAKGANVKNVQETSTEFRTVGSCVDWIL
ncbi:hypothetical protein KIMH_05710 [Bombiscardovia apis]|uniref:Uncharacterized protein n=1 Tax=Bombiscardovia apis TaxID=2932182 RepID=A0ABM8BC38_9BIFI|nr:hypothetical protein KIMH_05710 [Bombiscardovia apis]